MKTNKKHKGSLVAMLIAHYAFFTLVVILLAAGLTFTFNLMLNSILRTPPDSSNQKLLSRLQNGNYAAASSRGLLGQDAFLEVVNAAGEVVYTGNSKYAADAYSPEELACIPSAQQEWYCYSAQYQDQQGEEFTIYTFGWVNANEDELTDAVLITDREQRVVSASIGLPEGLQSLTRLSARQTQLLLGSRDGYDISSLSFTGKDGGAYTAVLFRRPLTESDIDKMLLLSNGMPVLFFLVYLVIVLIFVRWLSLRVKKPLALLSTGMQQLAQGTHGAQLQYSGPVEFEQMCDSFNRLSDRLGQAEIDRKKAESDKQKMLADISHDLKTPITVIQGYAKAISDGLIPPQQQPVYLETIARKSAALTDLINTFYDYSRLEHPEFRLTTGRRDLCEVAREYLAEKYTEIELAGFALEVEIPDSALECRLDSIQLRRVFDNLLSNALKHNPTGTRLLFAVSDAPGKKARMLIADSGVGIPPALAQHLFDAFVVGDDSRSTRQGSGLGLAVAKKIVEAHGGSIALLPAEGDWNTRFEILLPLDSTC